MSRLLAFVLATGTALAATAAVAAPTPTRVRGTVASLSGDILTVHTTSGADATITLTAKTGYRDVVKANLDQVDPGSYIGTAAKSVGSKLVALEVVVFPPSMKGVGEGHYAWDRLPDRTLAGGATTASTMTNGTVTAAGPAGGAQAVNTTMTNGTVTTAGEAGGAKQITVTYKGGKQIVIVPPNVPIVTFKPGARAGLTPGAPVFVAGVRQDGKLTANVVAIGIDGVKPPM